MCHAVSLACIEVAKEGLSVRQRACVGVIKRLREGKGWRVEGRRYNARGSGKGREEELGRGRTVDYEWRERKGE